MLLEIVNGLRTVFPENSIYANLVVLVWAFFLFHCHLSVLPWLRSIAIDSN
ncbi:unnamed protein product, partial [Allacma fusca]